MNDAARPKVHCTHTHVNAVQTFVDIWKMIPSQKWTRLFTGEHSNETDKVRRKTEKSTTQLSWLTLFSVFLCFLCFHKCRAPYFFSPLYCRPSSRVRILLKQTRNRRGSFPATVVRRRLLSAIAALPWPGSRYSFQGDSPWGWTNRVQASPNLMGWFT